MNGQNSQLTSNGSNTKFKSTKSSNQKIQPKPNGMLHSDPFHMEGYTKIQNKEAEAGGSQGQEVETIVVNMVKPRLY